MTVLVARLLGRGGQVGLAWSVLRRSGADVVTLLLYDMVGGGFLVIAAVVLGITRPCARDRVSN